MEATLRESPSATARRGTTLVQAGMLEAGIPLLERACALEPCGGLLANLAVAYAMAGRTAEADQAFQKALRLAPEDLLLREDADAFYRRLRQSGSETGMGDEEYQARIRAEKAFYTAEYDKPATRESLTEECCAAWSAVLERTRALECAATGGADFVQYLQRAAKARTAPRILSLGSGPGGLELRLAEGLPPDAVVECVDMNEKLIARGRERAASLGLSVRFSCQDINRLQLEAGTYDLVMAHAALHHFVALEHIFSEVQRGLKRDGEFVVNDMVCRNGLRLWPETKEVIGHLWNLLPERYRINHTLYETVRVDEEYPDRNYLGDGFECIRSEEILPLLRTMFHVKHFVPYLCIARRFFDRMFGPNYDLSRPLDRAILDFVWHLDGALLRDSILRPESAFLVLQRKLEGLPGRGGERMRYTYCHGRGVEIGPGGSGIPGLDTVKVDICNNFNGTVYRVDHLHPGDHLPFFSDDEFDFIIHSNVFEHFANPLKAIQEWHRVIRPRGVLYLIVPDRRLWVPDRGKPATSSEAVRQAFDELRPNYPRNWAAGLPAAMYNVHHTFWTLAELRRVIEGLPTFRVLDGLESSEDVVRRIEREVTDPSPAAYSSNWDAIQRIQREMGAPQLGHNFELVLEVIK